MRSRPKMAPIQKPGKAPIQQQPATAEILAPQPAYEEKRKKFERHPSREGKKTITIFLSEIAWTQLRQLALDERTTNQLLGEEAFNLLFESRKLNRSA